MSGHPDSMSQDEENQEDQLISLSQAQVVGESLYIVHQVDPEEEEELAQQIHLQSDQQEEQQVIEMDEFIKMRRQENRKIASEKKLKEYRMKKDPERDMAKTKRHSFKNFNDSWLDSSVFKHWLQKHPHSNTKAICKVCNKVLLAGKSELMKHGSSQKHLKFLRVSKGMIKEDPDEESNDEGDAGNGFDEAWLEESMFKGWVSPHPDSMYKALCKACNQVLLATKSELTKHRNAKKHRDNMNSLISQDYEFFDATNGMEYGEEDQSMNQDTEYTIEAGTYALQSYLDMSQSKKIKHDEDEHEERPTPGNKRRLQRYRTAWEGQAEFAGWIKPVETDNLLAQCIVCNNIMNADVTVLKRHAASVKHENNMQQGHAAGFLYKREWERNKHLMHWLQRVPDNPEAAYCHVCNVLLNASISELKVHMRQESHKNLMGELMISELYDEKPKRSSRCKEKISIGNCSIQVPVELNSDGENEEQVEFILEEEHDTLTRFDTLSLQEDTEVQTETSETPVRVYRVKPATGGTSITTPSLSRTHATGSRAVADELENQAIVTQPAPHWKGKAVVNGHIQEIKLSDYKGRYLVMFFYPQDFSTVCSTEILALGDVISAFRVVNCEVIAISVDSHLAHLAWTKTLASSQNNESKTIVPLLSDSTHAISKAYGCYHAMTGHSLRAYYIIDKRGILRASNISDVQVGRNLKEILRLVEAFQLVDNTNTQCPVNWTMGQPSVKVTL